MPIGIESSLARAFGFQVALAQEDEAIPAMRRQADPSLESACLENAWHTGERLLEERSRPAQSAALSEAELEEQVGAREGEVDGDVLAIFAGLDVEFGMAVAQSG